jgi:hypothetical protein
MTTIQDWITEKLRNIADKLPTLIHTEPASFACGYNTGYKQAILDLDRFLEGNDNVSSCSKCNILYRCL